MSQTTRIFVLRGTWLKPLVVLAGAFWMQGLGFACAQTVQPQNWKLVWSDEFNGAAKSAPDSKVWTYDKGAGGWGNGELETYCEPSSDAAPCKTAHPNIYEDGNGHLVIQAIRGEDGTWTSGRLKTDGKKTFDYGRIEARMRFPVGAGFWPAFWMLGDTVSSAGWPTAGEQDIMEWVQSYGSSTTSSTVHGPGYSGAQGIGKHFLFPAGQRVDTAFHTYGVIWEKDRLQFYRDNPSRPFFTLTPADLPKGTAWVYNHPYFLLLNFAIGGGGFAGTTNATTPSTGKVLVDYVRVYRASPATAP